MSQCDIVTILKVEMGCIEINRVFKVHLYDAWYRSLIDTENGLQRNQQGCLH